MKSPWSAHERDQSYLSHEGVSFSKISNISGLNDPADGRCLAKLDYNRDGLTDLVASNQDYPTFRIYQNQSGTGHRNAFVALRLEGGNRTNLASAWSSRDAYGAIVRVRTDSDLQVRREKRAGEGLSSQNSSTLVIGLGSCGEIGSLSVTWPSGRVSTFNDLPLNKLVTVYENREHSESGEGIEIDDYHQINVPKVERSLTVHHPLTPLLEKFNSEYALLVTTATWCGPCKEALPSLENLGQRFEEAQLSFLGIPMDSKESEETLQNYEDSYRPAYRLLVESRETNVKVVGELFEQLLGKVVLPGCVLINAKGEVLGVWSRVPSYSELRVIMEKGEPQFDVLRSLHLPPTPEIPRDSMERFLRDKKP